MPRLKPQKLASIAKEYQGIVSEFPGEFDHNGCSSAYLTTGLGAIHASVSELKRRRDNGRVSLAQLESNYQNGGDANYAAFSNLVDMGAGAVGKDTPRGRQILE